MSPLDHVVLALESIRASPLRSFLTTLGVIIGVLSVILLVGLGDGVSGYLADTFAGLGSNLVEVTPGKNAKGSTNGPPLNAPRKLTQEDVRALQRRGRAISAVSPVVFGGATVRFGDHKRDVAVLGCGSAYPEMRNLQVAFGRFLDDDEGDSTRNVVVIGQTIRREMFGEENPLGRTLKVAEVPFRVIGVMGPKGQTFGFDLDDIAYVPAPTALDLFRLEGFTQVLLRSRNAQNTRDAMAEATEIITQRHAAEDFSVRSQDDLLKTINNILDTMTMVLLAIASISLIVGGIGIMNIMLVSVKERTREIGIRRAMGARRVDILMQFLVEAVVVSVMGGLVGLTLGALIIEGAHRAVPDLPVQLSWWIVGVALGFSALVGVLSGVIPARNAAATDPVEALRYE